MNLISSKFTHEYLIFVAIRALTEMDKEKTQELQQQPQPSADTAAKNGAKKPDEFQDEFYNTGRIGRRNAMPDILGNNCTASSGADLPLKLSALTTNGERTRDELIRS